MPISGPAGTPNRLVMAASSELDPAYFSRPSLTRAALSTWAENTAQVSVNSGW
jgi:hypothetical protein